MTEEKRKASAERMFWLAVILALADFTIAHLIHGVPILGILFWPKVLLGFGWIALAIELKRKYGL